MPILLPAGPGGGKGAVFLDALGRRILSADHKRRAGFPSERCCCPAGEEPPPDEPVPCDCHSPELLTFDALFAGVQACAGLLLAFGGANSYRVNAMNLNRRIRMERKPGINPDTSLPWCDFYYREGPQFPGAPPNVTFDIDFWFNNTGAGPPDETVDSWELYGGPVGLLYVVAYTPNRGFAIFRANSTGLACVDGKYVNTAYANELEPGDCGGVTGAEQAGHSGDVTLIPVHV